MWCVWLLFRSLGQPFRIKIHLSGPDDLVYLPKKMAQVVFRLVCWMENWKQFPKIGGNCLGIIKCFCSIDMWYVNGEWWPALSCWVRINVTTSGFTGVKLPWLTLELPVGLWQALGGLPPLMLGVPKQFVANGKGSRMNGSSFTGFFLPGWVFFSPNISEYQKLVMKHESCLVVSSYGNILHLPVALEKISIRQWPCMVMPPGILPLFFHANWPTTKFKHTLLWRIM